MTDVIWSMILLAFVWLHGFIGGRWFERRAKKDEID